MNDASPEQSLAASCSLPKPHHETSGKKDERTYESFSSLQKNVIKVSVIKTSIHATFDIDFWPYEYGTVSGSDCFDGRRIGIVQQEGKKNERKSDRSEMTRTCCSCAYQGRKIFHVNRNDLEPLSSPPCTNMKFQIVHISLYPFITWPETLPGCPRRSPWWTDCPSSPRSDSAWGGCPMRFCLSATAAMFVGKLHRPEITWHSWHRWRRNWWLVEKRAVFNRS